MTSLGFTSEPVLMLNVESFKFSPLQCYIVYTLPQKTTLEFCNVTLPAIQSTLYGGDIRVEEACRYVDVLPSLSFEFWDGSLLFQFYITLASKIQL